jgi:hypothetical protein
MRCVKPISVQKGRQVMLLRCGQCVACRVHKKDQWAIRMKHEYLMHDQNCFITLTYDDSKYSGETLVKRDLQLFIKRLRRKIPNVRYYMCGEYGGRFGRPHYHGILFGVGAVLKKLIDEAWQMGFIYIGEANIKSIKYVAKYVQKKAMGNSKNEMLEKGIQPEFSLMSLKPGLGVEFAEKYINNWVEKGYLIDEGRKKEIPRYYLTKCLDEPYQKKFSREKIEKCQENLIKKSIKENKTITEIKIKEGGENEQREKNLSAIIKIKEVKNGRSTNGY